MAASLAAPSMSDIEQRVRSDTGLDLAPARNYLELHPQKSFSLGLILRAMLQKYRERSMLALALMIAQAFLFNAVFFSYGLVLTMFHGVSEQTTGLYLLPLAASNFFGPVLLAPLFEPKMIVGTYAAAGVLLLMTALLLGVDAFTAWTQTIAWMAVFFFASAAASSAYLTASEIFPIEARALAIAIFYAIGTAIGGVAGPLHIASKRNAPYRSVRSPGRVPNARLAALGHFGIRPGSPPGVPGGGITGVMPPPTGGTARPGSMPAGGQITRFDRDS
jgi:MFS family permease